VFHFPSDVGLRTDILKVARLYYKGNAREPVFVLSTARAYSSVVSTMIGQHPLLYGFPELKLFACPTIGEVEASLPGTSALIDRSPGLVRAVAELLFGNQSLARPAGRRMFDRRDAASRTIAIRVPRAELGGILGYPAGGRNRGSAGPPGVGWKTTSTDCPTAI
jgi:hypothetical protein